MANRMGGQGNRYQARDVFDDPETRYKKLMTRKTVDYGSSMALWNQLRKTAMPIPSLRPQSDYIIDLLPPAVYIDNPASSLAMKYIHTSSNKNKHPINVARWTPEGRRVLTASSSGEFTLWNGLTFNFETILQAHESAVRACEWSPSGDWLLSGDHDGTIKYFRPNMNNLKVINAHTEAIRDLSFSPSSNKFVTASDDGTMKLWSFNEGLEERVFSGHGWDVKTVDWHPSKGLIVSGSKDNLVKLWDPRTAKCLTTLHGHKNTVSKVMFQKSRGELLATCSRDSTSRILDLRAMKDLRVLRGHEKDVTTLTWHPIVPSLLTTGGHDGAIHHYLLNESAKNTTNSISSSATLSYPSASIPYAHESAIWSMEYHPLGHLLVTGSNDRATRFWARPRPGDDTTFTDRYHLGENQALAIAEKTKRIREEEEMDEADGLIDQTAPVLNQYHHASVSGISLVPGLNQGFPPPPPLGGLGGVPGMFPGLPGFPPLPIPGTGGTGSGGGGVPGLGAMPLIPPPGVGQFPPGLRFGMSMLPGFPPPAPPPGAGLEGGMINPDRLRNMRQR